MLDAIRFAGRLGAELARLGLGRVIPESQRVPRTLERVDAAWLAGALAERFPNARVRSVRTLREHSGTTARRTLAIEYATEGEPPGAPRSVFVKVRPPRLTEELFGRVFALGPTEVAFYRDIRPGLPVRAPDCYAARMGKGGEFALLLEDLGASRAVFKTIADPVSLREAESVIDSLATLHAAFWRARRFPWLRTAADNPNAAIERFVCSSAHRPTLRRFADLLPEGVRRGAGRIHAERRALERYWSDGPLTLIHGDSHIGNMYFVGGQAGFFDWQVTQHHQGIRDVAYFLILSLDTELRRAHERALIGGYRRRLVELGVPVHDVDENWLWERYRSYSLYAYIATSVTSAMSDLQPAHIARTGLQRAATAVEDLGALRLLDRIVS